MFIIPSSLKSKFHKHEMLNLKLRSAKENWGGFLIILSRECSKLFSELQ